MTLRRRTAQCQQQTAQQADRTARPPGLSQNASHHTAQSPTLQASKTTRGGLCFATNKQSHPRAPGRALTPIEGLLRLPVAALRERLVLVLGGRAVEHRAAAGRAGAVAATRQQRQPPSIKPQSWPHSRRGPGLPQPSSRAGDTPPASCLLPLSPGRGKSQHSTSPLRRGSHPPPYAVSMGMVLVVGALKESTMSKPPVGGKPGIG